MSDFGELLDIAIKKETSPQYRDEAGKDRRGVILEDTLKGWEEKDYVSFASAFRITGNQIKDEDQFNPPDLPPKGHPVRKLFIKLTSSPGGQANEGIWPWNLFRKDIDDSGDETRGGLFPPQVLELNQEDESCEESLSECEPLGDKIELFAPKVDQVEGFTDEGFGEISKAFKDAYKEDGREKGDCVKRESWRWYSAFASVVGDYIRRQNSPDDFQPSKHLVYILGTRKEFARRPEADYGLVVGFTERAELEDEENLKEALNSVLAAWNILAVAPHIMEDARRIELMEAAQRLTHTFKTYIDSTALPAVKKSLRRGSINPEYGKEVTDAVKRISKLTAMMGFVARGSEGQLRSGTDFNDDYNIVEAIKGHFEDQLADKYQCNVRSDIEEDKRWGQWVSQFYLRCALSEIITNIEGQETEDTDVEVELKMEELVNSDGESTSNLKIRVENGMDNEEGDEEREVSGSGAVESFFEALGGGAEFYPTENDRYVTEARFNKDEWEERIEDSREDKDASDGSIEDTGESSDTEVPEIEPPQAEDVAFRVLLLDDELGARGAALPSLNEIDQDGRPAEDKWGKYERILGEENVTFKALYHGDLELEVVLCRRLKKAREHLLGDEVHFDVCLADIDFKKDIGYRNRGEPVPKLGGLLFAMGLVGEPKTYTSIFTAKDDLLRDVPDYRYLRKMKSKLGNLKFESEGSKEIDKSIKKSFYKWTKDVLIDELNPTDMSCIQVVESFHELEKNEVLELDKKRSGISNKVSSNMIKNIINNDEKIAEISNMLNESVCGHALVRLLFCKWAHNQVEKAFEGNLDYQSDQRRFNEAWSRACKLYNIEDKVKIENKIRGSNGKDYYRHDNIFELFDIQDYPYKLRIYGLTEEPCKKWCRVRDTIEDYIIEDGSGGDVKIEVEKDQYGKEITFVGNRTGEEYLKGQLGEGGSLQDIPEWLNKTVSEIKVDGEAGAGVMTPNGTFSRLDDGSNDPDVVSLTLTVHHFPATEDNE